MATLQALTEFTPFADDRHGFVLKDGVKTEGSSMTTLTRKQRAALRMKFGGRCAYCGCELPEKGWHADHAEAVLRKWEPGERQASGIRHTVATGECWRPENDVVENLFPACAPCNLFKATFTVEGFREQVAAQTERARAYSVNFRTAERFGLVKVTDRPVVFWFEQYQEGECAAGEVSRG